MGLWLVLLGIWWGFVSWLFKIRGGIIQIINIADDTLGSMWTLAVCFKSYIVVNPFPWWIYLLGTVLQTKWQMIKKRKTYTRLQCSKFVLGWLWEAFPICGVLVGFWRGFGGLCMGFWWGFSGVNCELLGVWFLITPFLGIWWVLHGFFMGLNWKSIEFDSNHGWWHWPIFGNWMGFWWALHGVVMGFW